MAIECAIDFGNEWGYLYCTVCKDVSLVGMINVEDLTKEKVEFEKEHDHDNR